MRRGQLLAATLGIAGFGVLPVLAEVGHQDAVVGSREGKAGLVFHWASATPVVGFAQAADADGQAVYVSKVAAFTGGDIVLASPDPVLGEASLIVQVNSSTAKQFRGKSDRFAVYLAGEFVGTAPANIAGEIVSLDMTMLPPNSVRKIGGVLGSPVPVGPSISLVARETTAQAGGTITVDAFISGVADLRAYQIAIDVVAGGVGVLKAEELSIDTKRSDYVFAEVQAVDAIDRSKGRLTSAMFSGSVDVADHGYAGTFTIKVPQGVTGSVQVSVRADRMTLLRNPAGRPIAYQVGLPVRVPVGVGGASPRK